MGYQFPNADNMMQNRINFMGINNQYLYNNYMLYMQQMRNNPMYNTMNMMNNPMMNNNINK
jgi:hypothetical protein